MDAMFTWDFDGDSVYVCVRDGQVQRQVKLMENLTVDLGGNGELLGVEVTR